MLCLQRKYAIACRPKHKETGQSFRELAENVVAKCRYRADSSQVQRCIDGDVLNLDLAKHLSALFGIGPPIIEPESEEECLVLLGKLEVMRVRARLDVLRTQVATTEAAGQAAGVQKVDDISAERPKRRRVERGRRRTSRPQP